MTFLIITVLVSMLASFFCSLSEACLMSLSLADIAKISEKSPLVGSIWKNFRDNIQKPIAVILIINTFANTVGAAIAGTKFSDLFGVKWIGIFSVVFALMIILWSEIVPKTLGYKHNRFVASILGVPLRFLVIAMTPILVITQILTRPFTGKRNTATADALGDINVLTRFASINNLISKEQAKLVMRSIGLSKTKVTDVMMKREQIKYLSSTMTLTDALIAAHLHYHTRYPLVDDNDLDKIIGYVNFKDIVVALHINPKDPSLKGIMRPMLIVTETDNASVVLNKMTQAHHHIAIVQNAKGIVCGLVTLEDLIEEVVGEIEDEFDILPSFIRSMPNNRYMVGGATPLSEIKNRVCPDFPNEATSIDSWVRAQMKKLPSRNDTVTFGPYDFIIAKVRRSQIHEVIVVCKAK